jgi:aryl-alcohol dehydrogenase (NADP+)
VIDILGSLAQETGKSYAQIALNWLLQVPGITAPIIGARSLDQLNDNLGAVDWQLNENQVRQLSVASAIEDIYPYRFIREAQRI